MNETFFDVAKVNKNKSNWVVLVRGGLLEALQNRGIKPTPDDKWCWSLWKGYLEPPRSENNCVQKWFNATGLKHEYLHTSGHASKTALLEFANAINPAKLIFVHCDPGKRATVEFPNLIQLANGEKIVLTHL